MEKPKVLNSLACLAAGALAVLVLSPSHRPRTNVAPELAAPDPATSAPHVEQGAPIGTEGTLITPLYAPDPSHLILAPFDMIQRSASRKLGSKSLGAHKAVMPATPVAPAAPEPPNDPYERVITPLNVMDPTVLIIR